MKFVIRNIKKRMDVQDIIKCYEYKVTIVHAIRMSERGKTEDIYMIGAGHGYGLTINIVENYISDTGISHGGKGQIQIKNVIEVDQYGKITSILNQNAFKNKVKLPVWVMV